MPRKPRDIEPGVEYHLISRFVDREWFIRKTYERDSYLRLLGRSLENSDWRLNSFAIMSSHMHMKAVAGEQPLDRWIRPVHSAFADNLNRAHNRIGCVFVRGPKAYPVAPADSAYVLAYIHNNPVRANVCATAAGTDWTSHRAYIGQASVPSWLHVDEGLQRAGFTDREGFDRWVNDPARADTEHLFTEEYYERLELERREIPIDQQRDAAKESAEALTRLTAARVGVSLRQLQSSSRGEAERLARAVAVRSARLMALPGRAIANALQLSPARVSTLTNEVEPEIDAIARQVVGAWMSQSTK